jgi:hypothetical protein
MDRIEDKRISIDVLELSIRCLNQLSAQAINYIDQLENITAEEMISWRNIGRSTIREIRKELARYGTSLKNDYVASSKEDKQVIENIPKLILEIRWEVGRLERMVRRLYETLDKLHLDMTPKK